MRSITDFVKVKLMKPRYILKAVEISNKSFLSLMIESTGHEYLIDTESIPLDFLVYAFDKRFIDSPDLSLSFYNQGHIDIDGEVVCYRINLDKLSFNLLIHSKLDPKKAVTIERLLNKKMIAVLKDQKDAKADLFKSYEKQLKCSTCQKLGIESNELKVLIHLLGGAVKN